MHTDRLTPVSIRDRESKVYEMFLVFQSTLTTLLLESHIRPEGEDILIGATAILMTPIEALGTSVTNERTKP